MREYTYQNVRIELEESENPKIVIDGESIKINWDADAEEFNTGRLPYRSFGSVEEVARAIVDQQRSQA